MDSTSAVILKVETPDYKKMIVETSDKKKYFSDLSSLSMVYCFPKNMADWKDLSIDGYGLGLVWTCRFEVHLDQIVGLATKIENLTQTA